MKLGEGFSAGAVSSSLFGILGVIGSLDKPSSPAGEAKQHFHNRLFGRSHAQREEFRERILAVTLDDSCEAMPEYIKQKCGCGTFTSAFDDILPCPDRAEVADVMGDVPLARCLESESKGEPLSPHVGGIVLENLRHAFGPAFGEEWGDRRIYPQ